MRGVSERLRRWCRWYLAAWACVCLLICLFMWAGTGAFSELLRYLPWVAAAPLALLAAVAGSLLGRGWLAIALLSCIVFAWGVLGLNLAFGASKQDQGTLLRVMSWNVEGFAASKRADGFAQLAWEMALQDPDILMLQDARFDPAQLPQALRERLSAGHVSSLGQYMVISRWPLSQCALGRIDHSGETHTYQHCVAQVHGRQVKLVNVHLFTPRDGLNSVRAYGPLGLSDWSANLAARTQQVQRLAADLAAETGPVILAGDLNVTHRSTLLHTLLAAQLRDTHREAGLGFGYTFGHSLRPGMSFLRLDHVLASPHFRVLRWERGGTEVSDHRAVMVELQLQ